MIWLMMQQHAAKAAVWRRMHVNAVRRRIHVNAAACSERSRAAFRSLRLQAVFSFRFAAPTTDHRHLLSRTSASQPLAPPSSRFRSSLLSKLAVQTRKPTVLANQNTQTRNPYSQTRNPTPYTLHPARVGCRGQGFGVWSVTWSSNLVRPGIPTRRRRDPHGKTSGPVSNP